MKHYCRAYYNAQCGVYQERRLTKSTQFVVGAYVLVFGLGFLLINQGMHAKWGHPVAIKSSTHTRLVAHNAMTGAALSAPLASAPTTTPAVANQMAQIGTAVQEVIAKPPAATWSIAVYDLQAQSWLYRNNSSDQMISASLYKLYAVYGLSKKLPFAQWASTPIAGKDMQACVDLMIRVSDNTCGIAVRNYIGWQAIDTAIHAAGYSGTTLNPKTGPVTTADDTTRFMAELYQGKLFDAATTEFLKASLKHQAYRSAIPAGCRGCMTYNKTANEDGMAHDSAIVVSGGHTYAVTIMSQGGNYSKIAIVERAIQSVIAPASP